MATKGLLQVLDEDLQLIYDVAAYLATIAAKDPKAGALLARVQSKQTELLGYKQQLNGG